MPPNSARSARRVRQYQRLILCGSRSDTPCDHCSLNSLDCIVMADNPKLKCAECVKRGRPCVSMSWEGVEKQVVEQRADIAADEKQLWEQLRRLSELQARIARKRKVLELAEKRAKDQMNCLVREMEEDGEDMSRLVIEASNVEAELFGGDSLDPSLLDGSYDTAVTSSGC